PDVVYSIVVPAGQRLVATAEPEAGSVFAPAIYLIRAPSSNCNLAPKPCLAGDDQGGRPSRVTYANTSMADETVFVVIDGYEARGGRFVLTTSLGSQAGPGELLPFIDASEEEQARATPESFLWTPEGGKNPGGHAWPPGNASP